MFRLRLPGTSAGDESLSAASGAAFDRRNVRDWPNEPIPLLHGDMPILGFRIGKLAYCTDVSEIPESSFGLLEDLDVLVLDALQPQKHTTHFSLEEAIEAARRIAARQTLFTHIAHRMAHEPTNRSLPESMKLAFDGQRVEARL